MTGITPPDSKNKKETDSSQDLYQQVCESSARNRQLFFIWLAFALYVVITTASTTDLQLLLPNSFISLPTLGVQLPIIGYFMVTPWLVLALHFNLLQNLDTHAYKLDVWARRVYPDQTPPREAIQAFLFDFSMLERSGAFDIVTRFLSHFLCYILGPITIAILMLRFSDYQDYRYTLAQGLAFLLDVFVVFFAYNKLPPAIPTVKNQSPKVGCRSSIHKKTTPLIIFIFAVIALTFVVETIGVFYYGLPIKLKFPESFKSVVPSLFIPKLEVPWDTTLIDIDNRAPLHAALDRYMNTADWWDHRSNGSNFQHRSLQHAGLAHIDMRNSDMKNAYLQNANLFQAQLQGSDLACTHLEEADLTLAQLQRANLRYAYLQRAKLASAELQGAKLRNALLQEADLSNAQLQGADLTDADLRGSNLSGAQLQGAIINRTKIDFNPNTIAGTPLVKSWLAVDRSEVSQVEKDCLLENQRQEASSLQRTQQQVSASALQHQLDKLVTNPKMYINIAHDLVKNLCGDRGLATATLKAQVLNNWGEEKPELVRAYEAIKECAIGQNMVYE